jgi:phenylacetate 2-hydroxylase
MWGSLGFAVQQENHTNLGGIWRGQRQSMGNGIQGRKIPLMISFYKEAVRFWWTTPFATPRTTVNDIKYRGTTIPKGITMMMNTQEANHDKSW